jgi:hypothetical protein
MARADFKKEPKFRSAIGNNDSVFNIIKKEVEKNRSAILEDIKPTIKPKYIEPGTVIDLEGCISKETTR